MASGSAYTNKKERNKMTPEQKTQLIAACESGDDRRIGVESVKKEFSRLMEIERLAIAFITTTRQRNAETFFAADVWAFALAIVENLKTKEIK